jgi:hypothetical protein
MRTTRNVQRPAFVIGALVVVLGGINALSARPAASTSVAIARTSDVIAIERASDGRLLAIGRLDRISRADSQVSVLGQNFELIAGAANSRFSDQAEIGVPVALFGELVDGKYVVDAAIVLEGQYVQGASKVYLRGQLSSINRRIGAVAIGGLRLNASSLMFDSGSASLKRGSTAAIIGTQPTVAGEILVERFVRATPDASVGTGRPDASVGTGKPDASVGTGRPDASVGTGRPDASVGTGRPDASVGTGRPDASVGTGRPDASVGTGSPEASVGTGSPEASVGTGRPDASVGTGRPDASVGTGRPDASVGTGRPDASVGTGSPEASVGTGSPEASVGTGRPDASVGTGRPDASVGTGRPDASVGTGSSAG